MHNQMRRTFIHMKLFPSSHMLLAFIAIPLFRFVELLLLTKLVNTIQNRFCFIFGRGPRYIVNWLVCAFKLFQVEPLLY